MLSRAAVRVTRPLAARNTAVSIRPSAVALGKRPAIGPLASIPLGARGLSWTPWKSSTPTTSSSAPAAEPALVSESTSTEGVTAAHTPTTTPHHESLIEALKAHPTNDGPSIADSISSLPSAASTDPSLLPQSPALSNIPSLEELVLHSGKSLSEVLHSPEAVHAAIKTSDLKLIGLEHGVFGLTGWIQEAVVGMHSVTGLPWWASIAALTITFRLTTLPLIVRTLRHNVRLAAVKPQMQGLFKRLSEAKANKDQQAMQVVSQSLANLMKEKDVSPFRPLLTPLIQMPFFLCFFWGLRGLAQLPLPQLKEGGLGWVMDLTLSDPYYILPITSVIMTNLAFRVGSDGTGAATSANSNMGHFKNGISVISVVAIPFIGQMPAAVLFYWTVTNTFTFLQASLLKQPIIKAILAIPPAPPAPPPPPGTELANPNPSYKETWQALKDQLRGPNSMMARAKQMQADAIEKDRKLQAQLSSSTMQRGGDVMYERVKEAPLPPVANGQGQEETIKGSGSAKTAAEQSWMEPAKEESAGVKRAPTKEEIKRQRMAAAREKRARQ